MSYFVSVIFSNTGNQIVTFSYTNSSGAYVLLHINPNQQIPRNSDFTLHGTYPLTLQRGPYTQYLTPTFTANVTTIDVNTAFAGLAPSFKFLNTGSKAISGEYTNVARAAAPFVVTPGDEKRISDFSPVEGFTVQRDEVKKTVSYPITENSDDEVEIDLNKHFE
ncbi:hypothetical protein DFH11DRAFT_1548592 [Phellopilus nigrolimitatus]|nr:hypothetical protein DFH11DRAFT_1548592 [Phellopilus nigrolimitatus]